MGEPVSPIPEGKLTNGPSISEANSRICVRRASDAFNCSMEGAGVSEPSAHAGQFRVMPMRRGDRARILKSVSGGNA